LAIVGCPEHHTSSQGAECPEKSVHPKATTQEYPLPWSTSKVLLMFMPLKHRDSLSQLSVDRYSLRHSRRQFRKGESAMEWQRLSKA
jgi:hypothetical protein